MPRAPAAHTVYSRLLASKGSGYPMYVPEPPDVADDNDKRKAYHARGVDIGDVGVLDGGTFSFLFSMRHGAEHPINFNGLPGGYKHKEVQTEEIESREGFHPSPSDIRTDSMMRSDLAIEGQVGVPSHTSPSSPFVCVGSGFHFESSSTEGAVLVLPEGALRADLTAMAKVKFRDEADNHAFSWRNFAKGGSTNQSGPTSLYLITGVDKTTSWGIASYSNASSNKNMSLKFKTASVISGSVRYTYRWEVSSGADVRVGPRSSDAQQIMLQRRLMTNLLHTQGHQGRVENRDGQSSSQNRARGRGGASNQERRGRTRNNGRHDNDARIPPHRNAQQSLVSDIDHETNGQTSAQLQNQCVFIRGYLLSFRDDLLPLRQPIKISDMAKASETPKDSFGGSHTSGSRIRSLLERLGWRNSEYTGGEKMSTGQSISAANGVHGSSIVSTVVIDDIQGVSEPFHPSIVINKFLLDKVSDAQVAATHDDEWISVIHESGTSVFTDEELCRLINEKYDAVASSDGQCAFWKQRTTPGEDDRQHPPPVIYRKKHLRKFVGNALQAAASQGNAAVVQKLLDEGEDVNAEGGVFGTALQAAHQKGHTPIVQMLLERGANVNLLGSNTLYMASENGDISMVQVLLNCGADVNARGEEYGHALQAACASGHTSIVQMLLEKGADTNAQGGKYGHALQAACANGYISIVQMLLKKGADANAQGGKYGSALYAACAQDNTVIVQTLLENGTDINCGKYGNALQYAAKHGNMSIVQMLLNNGADINAQGGEYGNALQAAAANNSISVVQQLLNNGADINMQGGTYGNALQAAVVKGEISIVRLLINNGAEINAQGGLYGNALHAAAAARRISVVQTLLDNGADINAHGGTHGYALHAASANGDLPTVQMLLDNGADINAHGGIHGYALHAASANGSLPTVQMLLDRGADINAHDGTQGYALHAASTSGDMSTVQMLLDRGADLKAQGGQYGSALQAACAQYFNSTSIVQILLDNGADINEQGGKYGNALQAAANAGRRSTVQLLLNNGANIDAQGGEYGNALQAACAQGHTAIVKILLDNGADVNAQGGKHKNSLQAALDRDNQSIVNLLKGHGADRNAESQHPLKDKA